MAGDVSVRLVRILQFDIVRTGESSGIRFEVAELGEDLLFKFVVRYGSRELEMLDMRFAFDDYLHELVNRVSQQELLQISSNCFQPFQ